MASKNPFGQLNIRRDEDDEEVTQKLSGAHITSSTPLFTSAAADKKKKKVRPDEKKKTDEQVPQEDTEEGFEVVKKKAAPTQRPRANKDVEENVVDEKKKEFHLKNKGAYAERNNKTTPGKRVHDKQSGTGRGKEIAKNGAGGKHTWGTNPKNTARDDEYNGDDSVFERVLNPKPRVVREAREEKVVEPVVEATPVVEETPKVEEAEVFAEDKHWDRKNKKKGGVEEVVNKEDLLERPENAVSYSEYLVKLKEKNQALSSQVKPKVHAVDNSDLKTNVKQEVDILALKSDDKKQKSKPKPKEKKAEQFLEAAFTAEDESVRRFDGKERNGGKKKGAKFQFSQEEFPEL